MSYPYQGFGNDVPMITHTDWASVAKQWASLRATVNIGPSHGALRGDVDFRNMPPPPPPPPSPPLSHPMNIRLSDQSNAFPSYNNHNDIITSNIDGSAGLDVLYDHSHDFGQSCKPPQDFNHSYNQSGEFEKTFDQLPVFSSSYNGSISQSSNYSHSLNQPPSFSNPINQSYNFPQSIDHPNNLNNEDNHYNNSHESYYQYDNFNENGNHAFYPSNDKDGQVIKNPYTLFEEEYSTAKKKCETFDYNHGSEEYNFYNDSDSYATPVTTVPFTQNLWNHPPPDHPDIHLNYQQENFTSPEASVPKLFPIVNNFQSNNVRQSPVLMQNKQTFDSQIYNEMSHDNAFIAARPTKGLPAWIIDDMKKMKEKEHKKASHNMDIYKDIHVNSRRDDEGDVVMEDVVRETDKEVTVSGKSVTKLPIGKSATETDIDDVSLQGDDEVVSKIDYSTKSLSELISMLDESELSNLKITVIRNFLTEVMKEITDDMIFATVKSTFSRELTKGKKSHKHKGKSGAHDSPPVKQQTEVLSQLLGLDVYESDDDEEDGVPISDTKSVTVLQEPKELKNVQKESHIASTGGSDKSSKVRSGGHHSSKDRSRVSRSRSRSPSTSKRKQKSKVRGDNEKSREKRRSHKKSKKHSESGEKWNHDNYEKSWKKF